MMIFCLCYLALLTIPNIIIDLLQIGHVKRFAKTPAIILPESDYAISASYSLASLRFSIFSHIVEAAIFMGWVGFGLAMWQEFLAEEAALGFILFVLGFLLINSLLQLPLNAYKQLILDKRYGFSNTTWRIFLADSLKGYAIMGIFGFIVLWILLMVMDYAYWWVLGFGIVFAMVVLINALYPTLIAPIFNTFTPLNDETLASRIAHLMDRAGFKASGVFVMDASRRDGRLNAYFGGLGSTKRVVLFDTLLEKVSQEGLLAILAHELGHFKHKDVLFNLALSACVLFVLFFIAGNLPSSLFHTLGLQNNHATCLSILLLIAPIVSFWVMPFIGYFSRKAEYRADSYSAKLTSPRCLKEALIRLVNENKTFPHSHPAYIFFHYTHPPLLERLCSLDRFAKQPQVSINADSADKQADVCY